MRSPKAWQALLKARVAAMFELAEGHVRPPPTHTLTNDPRQQHDEFISEVCFQEMLARSLLDDLEPVLNAYHLNKEAIVRQQRPEQPFVATISASITENQTPPPMQQHLNYALHGLYIKSAKRKRVEPRQTDIIETIASWHELQSVKLYLSDHDVAGVSETSFDELIEEAKNIQSLASTTARTQNQYHIRTYLLNRWVYPWAVSRKGTSLGDLYRPVFDLIDMRNQGDPMLDRSLLDDLLTPIKSDTELYNSIIRLLEQLFSSAQENRYDGWRDILEDGGCPIPNLPSNVVFIPGQGDGRCGNIVVAIAENTSPKSKHGTVQVMRELRDYLITCCDNTSIPQTQVAIFVAPLQGMASALTESQGDLLTHMNKRALKVFIPIVIYGGKLSLINWQ